MKQLLAFLYSCTEPVEKPLEEVSHFETVIPVTGTRIREASPDENFAGKPLYLGASADGIDIALLQYDVSSLKGKDIEKALLRFDAGQTCHSSYVLTYPKCGLDLVVEAHEIEHPWEEETVTWNSFDNKYTPRVLGTALLHVPEGEQKFCSPEDVGFKKARNFTTECPRYTVDRK